MFTLLMVRVYSKLIKDSYNKAVNHYDYTTTQSNNYILF